MRCIWTISVPENYNIKLNLIDIQTESCVDYVKIFDGRSVNDSLIGTICSDSSTRIFTLNSTSNFMTIKFDSDRSNNFRGFLLQYTAVVPGEFKIYFSSGFIIFVINNFFD
jgi:hypothetical protein